MRPRFKIGQMIAVKSMPPETDQAPLTYYGLIDQVITSKDGILYRLEGMHGEWSEENVIQAYRAIPGSGAKKKAKRRSQASIYHKKPQEVPVDGAGHSER